MNAQLKIAVEEIDALIIKYAERGMPLAEALVEARKHIFERATNDSQSDSSDQGVFQKSSAQDSSEVATSILIDANPKSLRFQCSCGMTHLMQHTQSQEGIRLTVFPPSSQTSQTGQFPLPSCNPEELRNALFGDSASVESITSTSSSQA